MTSQPAGADATRPVSAGAAVSTSALASPSASNSTPASAPARRHLPADDTPIRSVPLSDARLNDDSSLLFSSSQGRKRKHHAYAMDDLKPSIVVKPHPPSLTAKPRSLQPLMLLPREHLQLSFLNLVSPRGAFEPSPMNLYESSVKILDLESRVGARPVVLVARLDADKSVYVLERQSNTLYSLCQLGAWVQLPALAELSTACRLHLVSPKHHAPAASADSQPTETPHTHKENKKRRLAIEAIQSLVKRPTRSASVSGLCQPTDVSQASSLPTAESHSQESLGGAPAQAATTQASVGPEAEPQISSTTTQPEDSLVQPTADNIFENIRNQYMEVLYHSMGSLAYFAKGPLSRARAAFHLDCDSTLEMNDLVDFLKGLVLTTVQIDKKYRETLPEIIVKMKTTVADSDDEQAANKPKKRKSKKVKLGKDSLYPLEDDHARRWWTVHKPRAKDDEETMTTTDPQAEMRAQLSILRSRETQLQMILILEILALEPLLSSENDLPGLPGANQTPCSKQTPPRKRSKHNFPFLLEVSADRLCIWQSTALDEIKLVDESQASEVAMAQKSLRPTSDPLKDFCVDIIMPFFSARLPEQCDSINRKLGGPVLKSPRKSRPKKQEATSKTKSKPGTEMKRAAPSKPKNLESLFTKETERHRRSMSRGPGGVIALMRSVTTPMLKREGSEPASMTSIPRGDSSDHTASRPSSASTTKRKTEEKAKKEAQVQAELQDAINGLRKPNREVVGKALAEATERRATTSLSSLRKSKKPVQHTRVPNVVKATPVGTRFRDAFAKTGYGQPMDSRQGETVEMGLPVPSSASRIFSSGPRKRSFREAAIDEDGEEFGELPTPKKRDEKDMVGATPAKPAPSLRRFNTDSLAVSGYNDDAPILASSPVFARTNPQPAFFARGTLSHRDSGIGMPSSPSRGGPDGLAETPVKSRAGAGVGTVKAVPLPLPRSVAGTPSKRAATQHQATDEGVFVSDKTSSVAVSSTAAEAPRRVSIFERLGWDDDFDELA